MTWGGLLQPPLFYQSFNPQDLKVSTMSDKKFYYVIGGEYTDANFTALRSGSSKLDGPYPTRSEAETAWRSLSQSSTSNVLVRYDVVELSHTIDRRAMLAMGQSA